MLVQHGFDDYDDDERQFTDYWLFNLRSEKLIKITGKKSPEAMSGQCSLLGTSRGWEIFMRYSDYTMHLSQVFNPESQGSSIFLPPFPRQLALHIDMVKNVSLSTPNPNQDKDYIVAVYFFGSKLSYCMPNRDLEWKTIDTPFSYDFDSHILYSPKEEMFYLLTTGCAYMAALDLKNNKKNPNFSRLKLNNFPPLQQDESKILASCLRIDYMAEEEYSFSGHQRYIIQWYVEARKNDFSIARISEITKRFMVFKIEDKEEEEEEEGRRIINANYTEDIGDVCIFVGHSETFCLKASKYHGLKPNTIYYVGFGFGVYDIAKKSSREYSPSGSPTSTVCSLFLSP
ncbi:unnamed protein product [Cochlearia groenlandica]